MINLNRTLQSYMDQFGLKLEDVKSMTFDHDSLRAEVYTRPARRAQCGDCVVTEIRHYRLPDAGEDAL
jgi:hypothetical protein